jgi:hypothetical protein
MSRGSVENHLYVVAPSARERDEYAPGEERRDPLDALIVSLEYSHAQTAALDVLAREGIGQMTTTDLVAERTQLAEALGGPAPRGGAGELQRVRAKRAEAERALAQAGYRADSGPGDAAIEAQARERAARLAGREEHLMARAAGRPAAVDPQMLTRYRAMGEELDRRRGARARAESSSGRST